MFHVNEYKIVFRRMWHLYDLDGHGVIHRNGRYDTRCEIYIIQNPQQDIELPAFTGIAKLHPNDQPDKIVGKKIALRNAIGVWLEYYKEWQYSCADFYNKEVRTDIWRAFWVWVATWSPGHEYLYSDRC